MTSASSTEARLLREAISAAVAGKNLGEATMRAVVDAIITGGATPAQIGALLTALHLKGETVDELVGTAQALRARMLHVVTTGLVVDTCGTGGDGADLFNVSTAVALVVAGAGVAVAKHGNRAQSGRVGGADVLETLGVRIDLAPAGVARCIARAGVGFCFAPRFHGAMRFVAGPRREIGLRTIFNFVGPLSNPAGATVQLVGVSEPRWTEPMAEALRRLGAARALVVHGTDGIDEISTFAPTRVSELDANGVRTYELRPEDFGLGASGMLPRVADAAESATVIRAVLAGARGPARDLVLVNAAAALVLAGHAADWQAGMAVATAAVDGGQAATALARLVETSNEYQEEEPAR